MKVDVQILIDALTTERTSIDRAISALRQITPTTAPQTARVATVRPRRKRWTFISDETKRAIIARMTASESRGRTAKTIARELGIASGTVATRWGTWRRQLDAPVNGDAPVVQEATHEIVQ